MSDTEKPDAKTVLAQINKLKATISSLTDCDNNTRTTMLREMGDMARELETPSLLIQRICGLNIWESVTMLIASNMGLFTFVATHDSPVSAAEIARSCGADVLLVQRLLRCLVVFGAVTQTQASDGSRYSAMKIAQLFGSVEGKVALRSSIGFLAPGWLRLPEHLAVQNYNVLESGSETVYNDIYRAPGKTLWEILGDTPYAEDWGIFMQSFNSGHIDWLEYYPARHRLVDGAAESVQEVFMVDVGGCDGSQAAAFSARFPEVKGKFIVQDLPEMLPKTPPPGTTVIAHDFFQPFPVQLRGARVYYLRYISHDWSQARLVQILSHIRGAMTAGYSRLIVNDWIIPRGRRREIGKALQRCGRSGRAHSDRDLESSRRKERRRRRMPEVSLKKRDADDQHAVFSIARCKLPPLVSIPS